MGPANMCQTERPILHYDSSPALLVPSSTFGSDKEIWLKTKRNFFVFLHTLPLNLCVVRVHAFVAREISMLQSENLSLRFSTSSVQSMQTHVENPQETTRPQASPNARWSSQGGICRRTHTENSHSALWPYPSGVELALSWRSATVHIAVSKLSLAERTVGFGLGRTLLSLSKKRLGFVCDGDQTLPSKSSHLPRSGAAQRQREHAGLVPRLHNHSVFDTQTYSAPRSPTRFPVLSSSVQPRAGSFSSAIFISSVDCRTAAADAITDCMQERCARRSTN